MLHMLSCRSLPHRLLGPRGYRLGSVGDDMEAEGEGLFKFVTDSVSVVVANDPPMKTKLPRQLLKIVDGRMLVHVVTSKFPVQRMLSCRCPVFARDAHHVMCRTTIVPQLELARSHAIQKHLVGEQKKGALRKKCSIARRLQMPETLEVCL